MCLSQPPLVLLEMRSRGCYTCYEECARDICLWCFPHPSLLYRSISADLRHAHVSRHEKTKKKRSFRSNGPIDMNSNSIKFESTDDEH